MYSCWTLRKRGEYGGHILACDWLSWTHTSTLSSQYSNWSRKSIWIRSYKPIGPKSCAQWGVEKWNNRVRVFRPIPAILHRSPASPQYSIHGPYKGKRERISWIWVSADIQGLYSMCATQSKVRGWRRCEMPQMHQEGHQLRFYYKETLVKRRKGSPWDASPGKYRKRWV